MTNPVPPPRHGLVDDAEAFIAEKGRVEAERVVRARWSG